MDKNNQEEVVEIQTNVEEKKSQTNKKWTPLEVDIKFKDANSKDSKKKMVNKKRKDEEDGRKTPPHDERGRIDKKGTPTRRGSSLPSKAAPQQPQQVGGNATPRRTSQRQFQNAQPRQATTAPIDQQYGYGYNPYYASYPTVYYPYQGYPNYMMPVPLPNPQSFTSQTLTIPVVLTYLRSQVEFYFSTENLVKDLYLRKNMGESGWVEGTIVTGFRRVRGWMEHLAALESRELDESWALERLVHALQDSNVVEIEQEQVPRFRTPMWASWLIPSRPSSPTKSDLPVSREASAPESVEQSQPSHSEHTAESHSEQSHPVQSTHEHTKNQHVEHSQHTQHEHIEHTEEKKEEKHDAGQRADASPKRRKEKDVVKAMANLEIKEPSSWAATIAKTSGSPVKTSSPVKSPTNVKPASPIKAKPPSPVKSPQKTKSKAWSDQHDHAMDFSQAPTFSTPAKTEPASDPSTVEDDGWQMVGAPKKNKKPLTKQSSTRSRPSPTSRSDPDDAESEWTQKKGRHSKKFITNGQPE